MFYYGNMVKKTLVTSRVSRGRPSQRMSHSFDLSYPKKKNAYAISIDISLGISLEILSVISLNTS